MAISIRPASPDELVTLFTLMSRPFAEPTSPEALERHARYFEADRTRCAWEDGRMVGTFGAYSLELAIPGATAPAAGTTEVSVLETHRRRGVLRDMMQAHFEDVREREEPIAALWASESGIYRRFGYGMAAEACRVEIETTRSDFVGPVAAPGRVRVLALEEAEKELPPFYESFWRERPGHFARSDCWWENRRLYDPEIFREGASELRHVVYEEEGSLRGFAQYRVKHKWDGFGRNTVQVIELQAVTAQAHAALWRLLLDLDLVESVHAWNLSPDDGIQHLLADHRRLRRQLRDSVWVRLLDVRRALHARRYQPLAAPGSVVFAVRDEAWRENEGIYRLEVEAGEGRCRKVAEAPELSLDVADLGALYLGSGDLRSMHRAGVVKGDFEAVARLQSWLRGEREAWCPEIF